MLWIAVLISFFGFVFAAPGAVFIGGRAISRQQNGLISLAGPTMNYALAIIFWAVMLALPDPLSQVAGYGLIINAWLGLFNMIPFMPFDGAKVFAWNKVVYAVSVAIGVLLVAAPGMM